MDKTMRLLFVKKTLYIIFSMNKKRKTVMKCFNLFFQPFAFFFLKKLQVFS